MSVSVGIVGLPNVGKSTLFNALTKQRVAAANFPFCTIDPNVGVVPVPDERLAELARVAKSGRIVPTAIEFVDIAGLVRGAHKGEGLGNQFLANIRECDAIAMVVRNFENGDIVHVAGKIDPAADRETIELELAMADLGTVEKRLERAAKEAKAAAKEAVILKELLERVKATLDSGQAVRTMPLTAEDRLLLKPLALITIKPILYILNVMEEDAALPAGWSGETVRINVKQEEEIALVAPEEQAEYMAALGLTETGLHKLVRSAYRALGLLTFFTAGEMEAKAWTVTRGATAPQAAGVIHTDFEKGFIRAEVVNWKDYVDLGGEAGARDKGKLRTEGKTYVMQDGDVCHFLFN